MPNVYCTRRTVDYREIVARVEDALVCAGESRKGAREALMWIYPPPNVITELERPERQTLTAKFSLLLFWLMRTPAGGFLGRLWESNGIERMRGD